MKINHIFLLATLVVLVSLAFVNCANQGKRGFRRVHFDFDKSFIRNDMVPTMDKNVKIMQKRGRHFSTQSAYGHSDRGTWSLTIEGHCDERGSQEYNYALGARRAESAKSYMVTKGISADRIKTVSYGEDRPLKKDHDESAWWWNRRAEFMTK